MSKPRVLIIADVPNWAWARKAQQLQKHIDEFQIDICYSSEAQLGWGYDLYHTFEFLQVMALAGRKPAVTGITAHVWPTWEAKHGRGTVARWATYATEIHANSKLLQVEMERLLGHPVFYVPNGVDETFFVRDPKVIRPGHLVVGWVGKPNPRKGRAIVQEACAKAKANIEFKYIERNSQNALSPEEMREFYQGIHVLAVASDMDGTPNPALEAAACGCAVVSNRIGNMPEFIEHGKNGFLVERDSDSMAEALKLLSHDMKSTILMGRAARETIEREWTWKHLSKNYVELWNAALGRGPKRKT